MRWIVCLLLWSGAVCAAPLCDPFDSSAKNFELSTTPESKAQFMIAPDSEAGFVATWFCDTKYSWQATGFYGWRRNLLADWMAKAAALRVGSKTDRASAWDSYVTCKSTDPCAANYEALRVLYAKQIRSTAPAAIVWAVRDNPNGTSRPVYPLNADGSRNATSTGERVSELTTVCSCAVKAIEESGGTYCDVGGKPNAANPAQSVPADRVALCYRTN